MKDLNYWKKNAEEDYMNIPISVLRYITELEKSVPVEVVKFKVGDKVKITRELHGYGFDLYEEVTVIEREATDVLAENLRGDKWWITEEEGFIIN